MLPGAETPNALGSLRRALFSLNNNIDTFIQMLHDPHVIPEPVLVLSGLTLLVPAFRAYQLNNLYFAGSYAFLSFTTVGFHGTRSEYFFILDVIAIMNNVIGNGLVVHTKTAREIIPFWLCFSYSIISYFVGRKYQLFSFDPDWNTQMFFHALMHIFSSYAGMKFLEASSIVESS